MKPGEPEMTRTQAIPANPDNEYGWEKLYSERMAMAYGRKCGMQGAHRPLPELLRARRHLARRTRKGAGGHLPQNRGSRDGGTIEIWGDGSAIRSYTYVDDMVDGIYRLMQSDMDRPVNIGCPQYVTSRNWWKPSPTWPGRKITRTMSPARWGCIPATSATTASIPPAGSPDLP